MSPLAPRPAESPVAVLEQRSGTRRLRCELYADRVTSETSDLLSSRRLVLPLDSLSAHIVVRQKGALSALVAGTVLAAALAVALPTQPLAVVGALAAGLGAWGLSRHPCLVFPGQLADLELFRDVPDAATARRFVAQTIARIEACRQELRAEARQRADRVRVDRVDELLRLRELFAEGIIDRNDLGTAAELLARREERRIGFRRP